MSIEENLNKVIRRIEEIKDNKSIKEKVTLIAVTKTRSIEEINKAVAFGVKDIGENKAQEIEKKYDDIKGNPKIHMIGHLQTNKVRNLIDKVGLIHSLDRKSLLKEIDRIAKREGKIQEALIQLNISEEETKGGLKVEEIDEFLKMSAEYENIRIKGFMTMAPHVENKEIIRDVFKKTKEIYEETKIKNFDNFELEYISMGMTNDYEIAIEEGSNMVRIGTAIFGVRNYSNA